jgi:prolipoprotein diacylglyceryltransferase
MHPIIFKAGPLILYSFSLFLAIGLFLGSFVVWRYGREEQSEDKLFDSILVSFVFALVFSRLVYIFSHFSFFQLDVLKWMLFFHYPGFSFWGGFFGLILGVVFFTRSKIILRKFADLFSLGISLAIVFGDLGCYLGGCIVGTTARLPWAVAVPGFESLRHPLPLYLLLVDLLVSFLVFKSYTYLKDNRKDLSEARNGLTALFYLSLFFLMRGGAEFYKEKAVIVRGVSVVGVFLCISGFLGIVIFYIKIGRSIRADVRAILVKIRTILLKIYGKIKSVKKRENTIFLLNDSLTEEKKESFNGQQNS